MKATDIWNIRPLARPEAVVRGKDFRITVLTDRLLRLEYEENGHFRDTATQTVLCREMPVPSFTVSEDEGNLIVETEALRLKYDRRPFSGQGLTVALKGSYAVYGSMWHYGEKIRTFGGTARTLDEADGAIPLEDGLTSWQGYAVLEDSRSMGMDDEGNLLPARPRGTDLYFFGYGRDFKGCVRDFLRLSGPAPVIPRFALGNWWSRYYPYTQEGYRELMERFQAEGIPLSVSVLDMNWHVTDIDPEYGTGWTGYTWDREKFPEPEKLLSWLHDRGLRVTLNDHPADGVRASEEMYPRMAKAMGRDPKERVPFPYDAADPKYERAFEDTVLCPLEEMGVDFWWLDWQQKGGSSDPGMDPLFTLNHTRYLHALRRGLPPMILSRYGGPGSHRYPVGFSGDTCITWASLDFQPFFTSSAANIAFSRWSHDIGGHMHGAADPELTVRWVQFGVFSPVMRLHSSNNPFMEKEPWKFPPEEAGVIGRFMRLRHRLVPWLYSREIEFSARGGMPLRPMYFDYPMDGAAYHAKGQYMLGDVMTVRPVTKPMDREAMLSPADTFLPEGLWTDFFTGLRYRGGRKVTMYRPLESIPALVKAGGILPMDGDETPANGVPLPQNLLIRFFAGADGETVLTEDNGRLPQDPAYECVRTRIRMECGDGLRITIDPPEGNSGLIPTGRRYTVEIYGVGERAPDESGCGCSARYDGKRRVLALRLDADASQGAYLRWESMPDVPPVDRKDLLRQLLLPARIGYDLKGQVMEAAAANDDAACFLAQLHMLKLPEALYGAVLELYSAC